MPIDDFLDLSKRGLRALVIDDDAPMRGLLHDMLQRIGIQSRELEDAQSAIQFMESLKPSLILCDQVMQHMDGISFVTALRHLCAERVRKTPVIMVTGKADRRVVNAARDAGTNELLVKPVAIRDLRRRIQDVIFRPRPFIPGPHYFGPCRRRRSDPNYQGLERRKPAAISDYGQNAYV